MKSININFKELVDYIKDKDLKIEKLRFDAMERSKKIRELQEEHNKLEEQFSILNEKLRNEIFEYTIIRNENEVKINEYGLNYLLTLEHTLDEIREYIEHEWFKRGQLGIIDKSFQEWQLKDILQILDKVKE